MLVRPDIPVSSLPVTLSIDADEPVFVILRSHRDTRIKSCVKADGWRFEDDPPRWQLAIQEYRGTAEDRLADMGLQLLKLGFCVEFPSETLAQKAFTADFAPRQKKWLLAIGVPTARRIHIFHDFDDQSWESRQFQDRAFKASWTTYHAGATTASPKAWQELREFAQKEGCSISAEAEALMTDAEHAFKQALCVPLTSLPPAPVFVAQPEPVVATRNGILEHLCDDD